MTLLDINKIYCGNSLNILKTFPDKVFHCCITSPPYFGLRSYGTEKWKGGDSNCNHIIGNQVQDNKAKGAITFGVRPGCDSSTCKLCGAKRVDEQIGLESTPDEYVANLVEVFREVKRTLRDDGILWLNLGDSYSSQGGPQVPQTVNKLRIGGSDTQNNKKSRSPLNGLKPKDLIGIPWKVAFALRDDGWWLRSDIIWAKGVSGQKELTSQIYNAGIEIGIEQNKIEALIESLGLYVGNSMPESVMDRPSKSHEYLFMLTKSKKYFYDNEAVKEDSITKDPRRPYTSKGAWNIDGRPEEMHHGGEPRSTDSSKRNLRSVWTIGTKPLKAAHFATFSQELILNPIKASTSEKGCCPNCGAPYVRKVEKKPMVIRKTDRMAQMGEFGRTQSSGTMISPAESKTIGWEPSCNCGCQEVVPALVLDPFMGSGTTGLVARKLGRNFVGIDLNPEYVKMAEERIR